MIPPRPERPTREELQQSWAVTKIYLESARREINPSLLMTYEDWVDHNELELALDELERIGDESVQSVSYWRNLLAAARNMGLAEHADRYHRKLDELGV